MGWTHDLATDASPVGGHALDPPGAIVSLGIESEEAGRRSARSVA